MESEDREIPITDSDDDIELTEENFRLTNHLMHKRFHGLGDKKKKKEEEPVVHKEPKVRKGVRDAQAAKEKAAIEEEKKKAAWEESSKQKRIEEEKEKKAAWDRLSIKEKIERRELKKNFEKEQLARDEIQRDRDQAEEDSRILNADDGQTFEWVDYTEETEEVAEDK